MPLNVYDKNGIHLGFISNIFPAFQDAGYNTIHGVFMVALSEYMIGRENIDMEYIKDFLSSLYDCKTLFGKVNEDKLKKEVTERVNKNYSELSEFDYESTLTHLFLKNRHTSNSLSPALKLNIDNSMIKAYILLDIEKVTPRYDGIIIDEELQNLEYEKLEGIPPVILTIIDYPFLKIEPYGFGSTRDHIHLTILKIRSGNYKSTMRFQMHIDALKNSNALMYINDNEISKVLTSEKVYEYYK